VLSRELDSRGQPNAGRLCWRQACDRFRARRERS
jgi:hypothetical protein